MKNNKHIKKHVWSTVMIVLIIAFDQITKGIVQSSLQGHESVPFIKGIVQFTYARNEGIAFSMFSGARWLFAVLIFIVCGAILYYMYSNRASSLWLYWSLGVTVSGGIGNLIDRIIYGYVVDFIEPTFVNFAIFNIADCAVTLGAVSLIICFVIDGFKSRDKGDKVNTNE